MLATYSTNSQLWELELKARPLVTCAIKLTPHAHNKMLLAPVHN